MEDSLNLKVEAFIPANPQNNPELNQQIYFINKNNPLYCLSIDFEDAYLANTRNISSFYFTQKKLEEFYKKIEKPSNSEKPIDPPKLRKWCGLCNLNLQEKERNINNYFNDLRNENLIKNNIHSFFQTLKQPLINEPFSIFTKIKEYLLQRHQIQITNENPLDRSPPKREFITLNGKRLYKMGSNDQGGSANVEKYGLENDSAPTYILKKFDVLNRNEKENNIAQYLNDYSAFLSKLDHPNIIEYKEPVNIRTKSMIHHVCILMKYCNRGDLRTFLENHNNLSEQQAKDFLIQILKAFRYLKSLDPPIMHGDLKPENILIHEPDPKNHPRKYEVKLADFGCCQMMFEKNIHLFNPIRSLYTCSPQQLEIIRKKLEDTIMHLTKYPYSEGCDVWGLGIVLYYMVYKNNPWINLQVQEERTETELIKILKEIFFDENNRPKEISINFPEYPPVSQDLKNAIREMLVVDEIKRISFDQLFLKYNIEEQKPKQLKEKNNLSSISDGLNSRKSSMLSSIQSPYPKTYSIDYHHYYFKNQQLILGIPPKLPNEESKENENLKSSLLNLFSGDIEEETTLSAFNKKENNNGDIFEYSVESNGSSILIEMEYQDQINKCEKFIGFLRNLINRMEKLNENENYLSANLKILCFLLKKWKYVVFLPILKDFLLLKGNTIKTRGIKLKIVKLLSIRKVKKEALTKDFLDLLKDKKIFVELISDNIVDSNDFVEFIGDLIAEFKQKLTEEIIKDIHFEKSADEIKNKLGVYQDLSIILNANQWFSQKESPMNFKKIEKKRKEMDYKDLIIELNINID